MVLPLSEKSALEAHGHYGSARHPPHHQQRSILKQSLVALVALGLLCVKLVDVQVAGFDAFKSRPRGGIKWTTCADNSDYQCGSLTVPMDYTNTTYTDPEDVYHLALRKFPATAPKKLRKGALVINPGGPGGSGHNAVVRFGKEVSEIGAGRFDVIGFDPRGVNMTLPSLDCFKREEQQIRHVYDIFRRGSLKEVRGELTHEGGNLQAAEHKHLRKSNAHNKAVVQQCLLNGNEKVMRTSSTAFVARDIKSIFEALGQQEVYYYGFSYGTILGAVFAQMFPELSHRLVLDGVADADLYHNDLVEWSFSAMADTTTVFKSFFHFCVQAGPEHCALARHNITGETLYDEYQELLNKLVVEPFPVASSLGSGIIEASDIQYRVFQDLYKPKEWPHLAAVLAELSQGNGTLALESRYIPLSVPEWKENVFKSHLGHRMDNLATGAIMCGDTRKDPLEKASQYDLAVKLDAISPSGESWARFANLCSYWPYTPLETYRGPFNLTDTPIKLKHPVLFVGNTADPVTPLASAHRMTDLFGPSNAALLTHNGYGHCSTAQPSVCTAKHIRRYLLEGTLPPLETVCEPDAAPFLQELAAGDDVALKRSLQSMAEKGFA